VSLHPALTGPGYCMSALRASAGSSLTRAVTHVWHPVIHQRDALVANGTEIASGEPQRVRNRTGKQDSYGDARY
jgi:hypothetical protein